MSEVLASEPDQIRSKRTSARGTAQVLAMVSPAGPWVIRVAATLRLADRIADGVCELRALAAAAQVDADALARLLKFLTARGIFEQVEGEQCYRLNAAASLLRTGNASGLSAWLDLNGAGGRMDSTWSGLLTSLRTGGAAYTSMHGRSFWDELSGNPDLASSFEELMGHNARWFVGDVAGLYRWGEVQRVVDVGGGDGSLIAAVLLAHPHLTGALLELRAGASAAEKLLSERGILEHCTIIEGSFFDELPVGYDVYVLANVLHDWDDERAREILRRCAHAALPNGRILIVERTGDGGIAADITEEDLRYLLVFGGRARTVAQFSELAAGLGMKLHSVASGRSGISLVELGF